MLAALAQESLGIQARLARQLAQLGHHLLQLHQVKVGGEQFELRVGLQRQKSS